MSDMTAQEIEKPEKKVSRREFLKYGAVAAAVAASSATILGSIPEIRQETVTPTRLPQTGPASSIEEITIAQIQSMFAAGTLTAKSLVNSYLSRITALDQNGPQLNSILQVNPDALNIAGQIDRMRQSGTILGPMMGIPILLKDNLDTHDQMQTAAGSLALVGTPALQDSTVAANLRKAGAIILGKTNLSEWANFRSFFSSSGWSGRGGQCNMPYAIDRNPCGSSSGSGAAASGNLTTVSIGTETDGSIVCPANHNGVVGIKPTVGLVSRAGIIPISHTQDTAGPHARTVIDAAIVLDAIAQRTPDPRDPATSTSPIGKQGQKRPKLPASYAAFVNPNGLNGSRIGVSRDFEGFSPKLDAVFEQSLTAMSNAGATLVDVFFPHFSDIFSGLNEFTVLLFEFNLDAIVAPTDNPSWPTDLINGDHFVVGSSSPPAIVGYPNINVPMGMTFGVPVGISFFSTAFSEPTLIKLTSGFEAVTHARQVPQFLQTLPFSEPSPTPGRRHPRTKPTAGPLVSHL